MWNSRKRLIAIAAAVLILLLPAAAFASAGSSITAYNVDITVGENNVYHVEESITMTFEPDSYKHGLYRTINLEPFVFFEEDEQYYSREYSVLLKNLKIDANEWEIDTEDGILTLRIGDEDVYVDGQTITYNMSYDYDPGDDGFPEFDMFYYGIIGDEWNQTIDDVTFSIHMPSEFDPEDVGFSVGSYGAEGYDPATLQFTVDGTDITGKYLGQLQPFEGIWIRISLPAGYYTGVRTMDPAAEAVLWVSAGSLAVMGVLFLIFREKKKAVVTVEFEPPEGLTSADIGYVVDGITETRDVVSLIIYWASRGYIKIVEMAPEPGSKKKKKHGILFVKLKDLPEDANTYEQLMFDEMFHDGPRVSLKDLKYHFAQTIASTQKRITNKFTDEKTRIFTTGSRFLTDICCGLGALCPALMAAVSLFYGTYIFAVAAVFGMVLFGVGYAIGMLFTRVLYRWQSEKLSTKRGYMFLWAILTGMYYLAVFFGGFRIFEIWGLAVLGCAIALTVLAPFFRKRTEYGAELMGQILGLRRFIERAEKGRIEQLAAQNPEYFYDILPYAYVLGVSDVWAKQFESLALAPPGWYGGADMDGFTSGVFIGSLMNDMNRMETSLSAVKSSGGGGGSFSGGSSGGGFSGGGFGGGGGGSW